MVYTSANTAEVAELLAVAAARTGTTTRVMFDPYAFMDDYSELTEDEATFVVAVGWVDRPRNV